MSPSPRHNRSAILRRWPRTPIPRWSRRHRSPQSQAQPPLDPCGERGEFHSFTYKGPMFGREIPITTGWPSSERDGFVVTDIALMQTQNLAGDSIAQDVAEEIEPKYHDHGPRSRACTVPFSSEGGWARLGSSVWFILTRQQAGPRMTPCDRAGRALSTGQRKSARCRRREPRARQGGAAMTFILPVLPTVREFLRRSQATPAHRTQHRALPADARRGA